MTDFLSLGMGVQSSGLAMMAARGDLRPLGYDIKAAIFADTQGEPAEVYEWVEVLKDYVARSAHPFPIYVVTKGSLTNDSLVVNRSKKSGKLYQKNLIPLFTLDPETGSKGILVRKCTSEYKIREIVRKQKALLGPEVMSAWRRANREKIREWNALEPKVRRTLDPMAFGIKPICRTLIGISTDESQRVKPSREPFTENRWPLLELNMSRADCKRQQVEHIGRTAPRSACVYCPYHSDAEWVRIKANPTEWAKVVRFERAVQAANRLDEVARGVPYLHADRKPIDEVVLRPRKAKEGDDFEAHCEAEGMCGL